MLNENIDPERTIQWFFFILKITEILEWNIEVI